MASRPAGATPQLTAWARRSAPSQKSSLYTYLGNAAAGKDFRLGQAGRTLRADGVGVGRVGGSEDHTAIMGCAEGGRCERATLHPHGRPSTPPSAS